MCGRYALEELGQSFLSRFQIATPVDLADPRPEIFPSQLMPVVLRDGEVNRVELMQWGLIPHWSKEPKGWINAKAETAAQKPSFKRAFRQSRCLIPASAFFEWKKTPAGKEPYILKLKDQELFGFAGLYDTWYDPDGQPIRSYTILTCVPNALVAQVHHRMPVILKPEDEQTWLDRQTDLATLNQLLRPYPTEQMEAAPVSSMISNPATTAGTGKPGIQAQLL